jgi:hypothetical protein
MAVRVVKTFLAERPDGTPEDTVLPPVQREVTEMTERTMTASELATAKAAFISHARQLHNVLDE